jgi:hypothetical protein
VPTLRRAFLCALNAQGGGMRAPTDSIQAKVLGGALLVAPFAFLVLTALFREEGRGEGGRPF